ncbi:glutamate receptor ionotropic, delta-1-like [Homarus americanus]|uniref:glutamate receptor ionotropic, delta-1-like n=1 Tax=Homarus americanus TaxID=6706 RepID=UPI001C46A49D|nr:glutamate receptor ionotropic, delta-1-like [Homarus americanus]
MAISVRCRWQVLVVVMAVARWVLPMVGAHPRVVQMMQDVITHKKWDYVTLLYTNNNHTMTTIEASEVLAGLVSSMSAAIIYLPNLQQLSLGFTYSGGDTWTNINIRQPHYRAQFITIWDNEGHAAAFMNKAGHLGLFTQQQEWLILLPHNTTIYDMENLLKDAEIFIDSEVLVCSYDSKMESFILREVWRGGRGQPFQEGSWGMWSEEKGLVTAPMNNKYERRKDLRGFHLRVATIVTMPYESLVADQQLQNFREGYVVDVWHTLQEQLNFTYTATNTLFGSLQPDGVTWNGMVGMLQTDDADVAVAPLSITKIRSISIDFTIPIQIVSTRLYIRRPILEGTWTLYGQPFGGYLWMCIPVSIVVCAGMLWGLNWLTVYLKVNDHIILPLEALWIMFSGLVQQSTVIDPRPVSGKIVFFSGMWMGMILLTCYSAILVSILTTRQPKLPFKDFQALLDNPDWNLGVRTNTALADSLALAPPNSPMRLSWEHIVGKDPANNLPSNNDDALTNVLKGKYAFFANKEYIIYRLQRKLPLKQAMDIVDTNTDFLKRGIGFGLQKESPYKNLFNYVLTKMTQKGHLNRLKRKWWPNIDRNPDPHYPTPGFNEVFTLFIILGAGTILAVVFLMCEWFIYSKSRRVISWS